MYSHPGAAPTPGCPCSSITQLLGALCDTCLSGVSWKRMALGAPSREGARRALRRHAYATLLAKIFQRGTPRRSPRPSFAASTPPRNKILMISFDLRLSGCEDKADRLEHLLGQLDDGPEMDSVLELLVQLAGSAPLVPPSFSRDYASRRLSVQRHPRLTGYQSEELRRLESRVWSLICTEEWGALGAWQGTLGVMDAPPGTGLLTLGRGADTEERFERETRLSLFGALQYTRTSDLEIRLDMPPVPSNIEVTGLAIRVPPCLDQSEDEGFQSASNLTPDSQSEPSPSPEIDVWEALRSFEPGRRRCWESIGCPPGRKEEPYLTEAGREAFDHLYRLWEGQMGALSSTSVSALPLLPLHTQTQLVADLLNVLIGVASATFPLNHVTVQFEVRSGVCVSGTTPESVTRLLGELAQYGTHYLRLSRFSLQSAHKQGLVFQAFAGGLRRYLHYYRACVLCTPPSLSLMTIAFLFRKLGRQLRYLSELCRVDGSTAAGQPAFPVGVKLLSYLYNEAQSNCSNENYPVLLSLLRSSCEPYTRFVSDWVYSGVFRDVYGEFMIQVHEDYLSCRDRNFWLQGYTLISQDVEECVPVFLRHIANDVYVCGKTINLLKICCPQHYICWSELPVPRIAVTFSLQEVEEIERDCSVYQGRMERIAKQSALSREEQALRAEQAREELIVQVRESTSKTLESIRGRQLSQRLVAEAKKRELFEEIKEHLEKEQEWRNAAKLKKQEEDFSFARELRDREKRLQALEEQLEQRARKELIARYRHLSEEAARREWRALWRAQRLRLHRARAQFLQEQQQLIQALLERYPLGHGEVPQEKPPSSASSGEFIQESEASDGRCEGPLSIPESMPAVSPQSPLSSAAHHTPTSTDLDLDDFLVNVPRPAGSRRVDLALQDIGSDLSEGGSTLMKHDVNPDTPGDTSQGVRPRWACAARPHFGHLTGQQPRNEDRAYTVDAQVTPSLSVQTVLLSGDDSSIHRVMEVLHAETLQGFSPEQAGAGPVAEGGAVTDSALQQQPEDPLCTSVSGGISLEHSPGLKAASTEPMSREMDDQFTLSNGPSRPIPNAADASTDVGTLVSETVGHVASGSGNGLPRPRWSTHGRSSNCMLALEPSESPPDSIHVLSSGSCLGIGNVDSGMEPAQPSLPGIAYGHSSDSTLGVSCVVKGTESVQAPLPGSAYGHSSDSTLGVGCVVKGTESVRAPLPGSAYGHSSDSTLGVGCVVKGTESVRAPLPGSAYGHSSDSTLGVGCVVKGTESVRAPLPGSAYGHSSDSTLGVGCVVKGTVLDSTCKPTFQMTTTPQFPPTPAVLNEASVSRDARDSKPEAVSHTPSEHEDMSVWGTGISSEECAEQDYLRCLAARYPVEQYQDDYSLLTAASDSQLLQQVTRGPNGFPGSLAMRRATDTTAVRLSEMVSLPVLMKHSVTMPLITHVSLVNKAVVDYFFVELEVERHFEALRHFLLMEDGEFAQSLSDLLFEKLSSGQSPGELLTPLVLNSILSKALQYSLHGGSALAANFTFALRFLPERFHPHAPDALQCLELCYKVDWPLNIIITDSCMDKYKRLFSFLLQLKHMVWTLRDVWFHLKRAALVKGASHSTQFRQLQLFRHEMQHFVKVIQGYIANQILQVSWSEFIHKLSNASDLDSIHRTHADYLNRAIFRGLLTEKAAPVMNIIHSIFSLILKFRAQLIAQPWSSQQGEAVHPSFVAMQQSYNTFKYYSHFLFKVVTKLVNRGYQPHLEDFLLRINFNNYYKDF